MPIIQDHLLISKNVMTSATSLWPHEVTYLQLPGIRAWTPLRWWCGAGEVLYSITESSNNVPQVTQLEHSRSRRGSAPGQLGGRVRGLPPTTVFAYLRSLTWQLSHLRPVGGALPWLCAWRVPHPHSPATNGQGWRPPGIPAYSFQ